MSEPSKLHSLVDLGPTAMADHGRLLPEPFTARHMQELHEVADG